MGDTTSVSSFYNIITQERGSRIIFGDGSADNESSDEEEEEEEETNNNDDDYDGFMPDVMVVSRVDGVVTRYHQATSARHLQYQQQ